MTTIAFIGKTSPVSKDEATLLSTLGMGVALAGHDLVTTPVGSAAREVAEGFNAAAGRRPTRHKKPAKEADLAHVIFYDDEGTLYAQLLSSDPPVIEDHWQLITSLDRLTDFTSVMLGALAERDIDFTNGIRKKI